MRPRSGTRHTNYEDESHEPNLFYDIYSGEYAMASSHSWLLYEQ